jgi:outer membrane lipoprotein-sorting protein
MNASRRLASAGALLLPLLLSGCSLLSTTRRLPVPRPPAMVQTVAPEQLVALLNRRWAALDSLNATVDIQATALKTKEGEARDFTTFRGIILMRKPEMLRVYGRVPVIGTRMFDMVSDGQDVTMYIPHFNKVYKGSNTVKKKSANMVLNMRPRFFFDAVVVRGLEPDDLYTVTAETDTLVDETKKHLFTVPEYVISIMRSKPGSKQLTPVRVITFRRDDLLPYEQDLYDSEGNLETQIAYADYRDFGSGQYPSTVTIKRPLEEYQIVLMVENVQENQSLTDDQFQIDNIPEGTETQHLE